MRLPLPTGFPNVEVPRTIHWHLALAPYCGLPGTEVNVLLPNGYGLSLIHGRGHSTRRTVEAQVIRHHGDPLAVVPDASTPVVTGGGDTKGWADAAWLAAALSTLAALQSRL